MKIIQLYKDGRMILATDGIMYVDGRYNRANIKREVLARNKRFAANFPHKIADSFAVYRDRIGGPIGNIITL